MIMRAHVFSSLCTTASDTYSDRAACIACYSRVFMKLPQFWWKHVMLNVGGLAMRDSSRRFVLTCTCLVAKARHDQTLNEGMGT
jgi:hypothetical protein